MINVHGPANPKENASTLYGRNKQTVDILTRLNKNTVSATHTTNSTTFINRLPGSSFCHVDIYLHVDLFINPICIMGAIDRWT